MLIEDDMTRLGGAYFSYKELFDRVPTYSEVEELLRDLDREQTVRLLCQINADLRLSKRDREPAAKLQQEICAGFLDDETMDRFKRRFGPVHLTDRPHRRQDRKESSRNGNLGSCSFADVFPCNKAGRFRIQKHSLRLQA